jgi:hypothetical protein
MIAYASSKGADFVTSLIANLGSALMSIAVVGLLYEIFVRRSVTHEMYNIARLKQRLADVGVEDVSSEGSVDWRSLLAHAKDIQLVLVNDTGWIGRDWSAVLNAAADHAVTVRAYVPDHNSPGFPFLAQQLGVPQERLASIVDNMAATMESTWKSARDNDRGLAAGCRFDICPISDLAPYSLVKADQAWVMIAPACFGLPDHTNTIAIRFNTEKEKYPGTWFHAQFRTLMDRDIPASFSDVVS